MVLGQAVLVIGVLLELNVDQVSITLIINESSESGIFFNQIEV